MKKIVVMAILVTGCDWPFSYDYPVEWPGATPAGCGNGVLDPDETCDDGNQVGGDGCAANCLSTPIVLVNTATEGSQYDAAVGSGPNGFVVAFTSDAIPVIEDSEHVYAHRLDANGIPGLTGDGLPWELKMNVAGLAYSQEQPSVAMYGESLVGVWLDLNVVMTTAGDVRVRRMNLSDGFGDPEVTVNETVDDLQLDAVVGGNGVSTAMIVAWTSGPVAPRDVECRRVDAGAPVGAEASCSESVDGDEYGPAVAMAASGIYAVAWVRGDDVYVRFFDAGGNATSGDVAVSTAGGVQDEPAIAFDAVGRLMVVFRDTPEGASPVIRGRMYDAGGSAMGGDFVVSTTVMWTGEDVAKPAVAGDAGRDGAGVFLVAWYVPAVGVVGRLVSGPGVFAVNRMSAKETGQPFTDTGEFSISGGDAMRMRDPAAAAVAGKALVAWTDDATGLGSDIHARIVPTN